MIEMQYNFPLLPGQPAQWKDRLRAAVDTVGEDDYAALRPTFRSPHPHLLQTAAQWLHIPADRLSFTSGSHHGSLVAMVAAGLAGRPLAVDAIAYAGALEQARALGVRPVGCAVDAEGLLPESLGDVCQRERRAGTPIAALFATVTVHNPLGCTASLARRQALVKVAREQDLLLIEDGTYGFMDPAAPPRLWDLAPERTFFVNSLSKSYAPAARTGFVAAPPSFAAAVAAAIKNTSTGSSLVHHTAACTLLADGTADRTIAQKNAEGARRNAAARQLLDGRCWPGAPAAWHLWVNLPRSITPQAFEARLHERGVSLSGGNWFAAGPDAPHGFRLALGGEVDPARTQQGVKRVAEALAELPSA